MGIKVSYVSLNIKKSYISLYISIVLLDMTFYEGKTGKVVVVTRDRLAVWFILTFTFIAYYHLSRTFESRWWQGVIDTTLCDRVCQWLATGRWFSLGPPVSSTNIADRHDITEILLKVALNTINNKQTICEFDTPMWQGVRYTTICDNDRHWLAVIYHEHPLPHDFSIDSYIKTPMKMIFNSIKFYMFNFV